MFTALLFSFALAFVCIAMMGAGLVVVWRGARGRLVDDHDHCRACGYDLAGNFERPSRCTECGASLVGLAKVKAGRRRPRADLVIIGLAIMLLPVFAAIGLSATTEIITNGVAAAAPKPTNGPVAAAPMPAGCDQSVGPVKLRGAEHMNSFLVGPDGWEAWELRGVDGVRLIWWFKADRTFRVWIEPSDESHSLASIMGLPAVPADATSVSGTWRATTDKLLLGSLRTDTGATVADTTTPLDWVDGKLRIGIGNRRYMRAARTDLPS